MKRDSKKTIAAKKVEEHAETRDLILQTAERLFAERGVDGTSVRDITGAAGVNLGAIPYHFGTKLAVVREVFCRRLGPIEENRRSLLDALESKAGNKPVALEALLDALVRPIVEHGFVGSKGDVNFMRLMGRTFAEANLEVGDIIRSQVEPMHQRFLAAFSKALPNMPHDELFWQIGFVFGAMHHSFVVIGNADKMPGELRKLKIDREGLIHRLVSFTAAGLKAANHNFRKTQS